MKPQAILVAAILALAHALPAVADAGPQEPQVGYSYLKMQLR